MAYPGRDFRGYNRPPTPLAEIKIKKDGVNKKQMWQLQAPPHFTNDVRQWLTENYPIWIGRGGTVAWPPRSPDLTPLDFYVWGYMKSEVYKTVVRDENYLRNRIIEAANKVRNELTFNVSVRAIRKRARACVRENGGQFEHKIK